MQTQIQSHRQSFWGWCNLRFTIQRFTIHA